MVKQFTDKDKTELNIEDKRYKKSKKSNYNNEYENQRIEKRTELLDVSIFKDRKDLSDKVKEIENQQF
ncbi:unnamed protein product [Paramecium sonneborni]|uniref:Uncharacterized protein n=1 Tax=Paramecium sonneborni TaxID=65129 RepID=A0A8S1Q1L3_9CILI|nr:unnamed protein product [Paramecium sonneborni]